MNDLSKTKRDSSVAHLAEGRGEEKEQITSGLWLVEMRDDFFRAW